MLILKGYDIHLTKGDTGYLTVEINDGNKPYKINEGDSLTLSIKSVTGNPIFSKTVAAYEAIIFTPSDTQMLSVGRYKYDIQLNTIYNEVFTIIPVSSFYVEEGVTE